MAQYTQVNKCNTPQNEYEDKNHKVILIPTGKIVDKISNMSLSYLPGTKVLENVGLKKRYLNKIKSIHEKSTVKIILNEVNLTAITLHSGMSRAINSHHPYSILKINRTKIMLQLYETTTKKKYL